MAFVARLRTCEQAEQAERRFGSSGPLARAYECELIIGFARPGSHVSVLAPMREGFIGSPGTNSLKGSRGIGGRGKVRRAASSSCPRPYITILRCDAAATDRASRGSIVGCRLGTRPDICTRAARLAGTGLGS